jgi:hypothetical protein
LIFIYDGGIQGLACHMVVHGYEVTTEYEELLDEGGFRFCPTILKIMSRRCFMALTRCSHITNPATYVRRNVCKNMTSLNKIGG